VKGFPLPALWGARPRLLDDVISLRPNNFDLLRLLAASLVLVSHAYALTGRPEPAVWLTSDTLGFDAVLVFFALSGLLVTRSWVRDPKTLPYLAKRGLRILPALAASSLLTAYALGPFVTDLTVRDYLRSFGTLKYVVSNSLLVTDFELPGVFTANPSSTVNGSLGTLPVEAKAYALVLIVGLLVRARRRPLRMAALGAALAVVLFLGFSTGVEPSYKIYVLLATFAGGAAYSLGASRVALRGELAIAAIVLWVVSYHVALVPHGVLLAVTVPYFVAYLGAHALNVFRFLTAPGEVSYGVYVYAFPVEQTAIHVVGTSSAPVIIAASAFPTYVLAFLSWHVVESPCVHLIRHAHRLPSPIGDRFVRASNRSTERDLTPAEPMRVLP
jgi:peptidoglycan/LPS O-acetylase OafA/YrhL